MQQNTLVKLCLGVPVQEDVIEKQNFFIGFKVVEITFSLLIWFDNLCFLSNYPITSNLLIFFIINGLEVLPYFSMASGSIVTSPTLFVIFMIWVFISAQFLPVLLRFIDFIDCFQEPVLCSIGFIYYFLILNLINFCSYVLPFCFGFILLFIFQILEVRTYIIDRYFSFFPMNVFCAINFPLSIALAMPHKFRYVMSSFPFIVSQYKSGSNSVSLALALITQGCLTSDSPHFHFQPQSRCTSKSALKTNKLTNTTMHT